MCVREGKFKFFRSASVFFCWQLASARGNSSFSARRAGFGSGECASARENFSFSDGVQVRSVGNMRPRAKFSIFLLGEQVSEVENMHPRAKIRGFPLGEHDFLLATCTREAEIQKTHSHSTVAVKPVGAVGGIVSGSISLVSFSSEHPGSSGKSVNPSPSLSSPSEQAGV